MIKKMSVAIFAVLALFVGISSTQAKTNIQWVNGPTDAAVLERFHSDNPDVTIEIVDRGTSPNVSEKTLTMISGGLVPDLMTIGNETVYEFAAQGLILPIDNYLAKESSINAANYYPPCWQAFNFLGHQWGVPSYGNVHALFYNTQLFNAAGLAVPPARWDDPNWTWDNFRQLAKKMTVDKNGDNRPDQWGIHSLGSVYYWPAIFGGAVFDKNFKWALMDPASLKGVQLMQDIYDG